jgi:hypothetical protein
MAKVIKYGDTSNIEGSREQAPVGLYFAKVAELNQKKSKNDEPMVELIWEITKDASGKKVKKPFARIWSYAPLDENASWARRLKELVEAFGLKASGGNLGTIEGKEALIRLREDTDQDGEYRPQVAKVLKPKVTDEEEPDEPDEAEDEEEDEDEKSTTNGLANLSRAELKALIKEESLEVKVLKSMSDDDVRESIIAAGWEPEGDEEEDEEEEDDAEEEEEDDAEEEEEDEEAEAEEDNYDDMTLAELRQEAKDRELDSKGKQAVLIARLRADDEEEPV